MSADDTSLAAVPWERVAAEHLTSQMAPGAKVFEARVADGVLRALVERVEPGWHLSISHSVVEAGGRRPGRLPTWAEVRSARYRMTPDRVTMAMLLPPRKEFVDVHPTTLHLWEVPGAAR